MRRRRNGARQLQLDIYTSSLGRREYQLYEEPGDDIRVLAYLGVGPRAWHEVRFSVWVSKGEALNILGIMSDAGDLQWHRRTRQEDALVDELREKYGHMLDQMIAWHFDAMRDGVYTVQL